jgi:hypothetical protein
MTASGSLTKFIYKPVPVVGKRFHIHTLLRSLLNSSVAEPELELELELEPEPLEQQLFAGAGAKVFLAQLRVCKFLQNVTKTLNLACLSFKLTLKITISLLFTLKNLLMIIYVFTNMNFFVKTIKIVDFFLIIWGKLSELEPEFFTSWSRTKMDLLRNTASSSIIFVKPES